MDHIKKLLKEHDYVVTVSIEESGSRVDISLPLRLLEPRREAITKSYYLRYEGEKPCLSLRNSNSATQHNVWVDTAFFRFFVCCDVLWSCITWSYDEILISVEGENWLSLRRKLAPPPDLRKEEKAFDILEDFLENGLSDRLRQKAELLEVKEAFDLLAGLFGGSINNFLEED